MPQGLGRNLYPTLSVFENIDFFGRLFGQSASERRARITELLTATALDPFEDRPAGKLSGGMKQKLSLCCALINDPDLLILDEPTTGVDPLSRGQFWDLINTIRARRPQMSVDGGDGLYGRSAALRLADGHGRRQDHRPRHAEGTTGKDGRTYARRSVYRTSAGGKARPSSKGDRAAARSFGGRSAGDRGRGPDAAVRRFRRRGSRQLQDRAAAKSSASSAPTVAASRPQ